MSVDVTKKSFVDRVIAFVKGGDDANVIAVQNTAKQIWTKAISVAKANIEKLATKLAEDLEAQVEYANDAQIAYEEAFLNITVEKLSRDERIVYVKNEWQGAIATALTNVDHVEAKITILKEEAKRKTDDEQKSIAIYEKYLAEIA
jgi:hypothetical protein